MYVYVVMSHVYLDFYFVFCLPQSVCSVLDCSHFSVIFIHCVCFAGTVLSGDW